MPIQFVCPNGHALAAPRKHAGMPGRCPTCDVAYVTPVADEVSPASSANSGNAEVVGGEGQSAEESFQFLCPNGHKINAPARLAGEAGQCPRCGERFHIPEVAAGSKVGGQSDSGEIAPGSGGNVDTDAESVIPLGMAKPGWGVPVAALNGEQNMAEVVSWFWQEKGPEQQIEITLRDGTIVQPTAFASNVSSGEVGIFGQGEPGGGVTLRAIAWEAILQVTVRNLADEVDDLFRE